MWLQLVLPWGGVTPKIRPFSRSAAALSCNSESHMYESSTTWQLETSLTDKQTKQATDTARHTVDSDRADCTV